ncbi:MAG TPA: UvrB/UvrC motif-containing protein [Pirellulales bacterium]|jgi:protein arginine kinase activator|nr:UvrB/UvrC motif-containing protein [Pirellulales bacterium]
MKCQKCDKPATFHITELAGGKPVELHVCEEHAREYLSETESDAGSAGNLTGALQAQLSVGQTAEELAKLDQQACPICGITFFEFRNQGRLGCPHDYVYFQKELDPLILNIHGELEHTGKHPKRSQGSTDRQTELIRLRRELKEAVVGENYERASALRDEIKQIEASGAGSRESGETKPKPTANP